MPEVGHRPRFVQIYDIDSAQDQADTRLEHVFDLYPNTLRQLQRMLQAVKSSVESFKHCADRARGATESRICPHQVDTTYHQRGTHNLPIFKEVAAVIIGDS